MKVVFIYLSILEIPLKTDPRLVLSLMPNINLNRKTRNKDLYCQFPKKSHKFSTSFSPHFTKLFNNLSTELQVETYIFVFKEKLKVKPKPKNTNISVGGQKEEMFCKPNYMLVDHF